MSVTAWPAVSDDYFHALNEARVASERIRDATTPPEDMPIDALYFLSFDGKSGYGVSPKGELIGLFSLAPGRGKVMVEDAIELDGVQYLDCFDGFLPSYYEKFGFVEYKREANWTEGGPDVVYMRMHNAPIPDSDLSWP